VNQVAIVGASASGLATAESLRTMGFKGAITLIGDEPHLPYDRPPLSKQILTGEWKPERLALRQPSNIDALDLDLRLGLRAAALDADSRKVTLADGAVVPYEALVVATGVRSRRLHEADGIVGVHTLRTVEDALNLKARMRPGRRLVIVGAGFIGAEVAAVARGLGIEVTMLEAAPVPLAQAIGEEAGLLLADVHRDNGVQLHTGVGVAKLHSAEGEIRAVELADGRTFPADDVLVAIGSVPNTEWLDGSGLTLANGLVCDEFSAAAPGVYGVGDVAVWHNPLFGAAMRIEHRTNAAEQALAVARNLLAPDQSRPFAPVPYFWSDQYGMKIQAYGNLRGFDEAAVVENDMYAPHPRLLVAYRKGDKVAGVLTIGMAPKALRVWRLLISSSGSWDAVASAAAA
jgi:NADPH-dependent 2,4-dienoyl-CoA reductase/sulfur reductase-like enzyme